MIDVSNPIIFAFLTRVADRAAERITKTPKLDPKHPLERKIEVLERQLESLQKVRGEVQQQGAAGAQVHPVPPLAKPAKPYSNYAPWMSSTPTSCIACARGHLGAVQAGIRRALESADESPPLPAAPGTPYGEARERMIQVAGILKEALRFARDDGMNHPEVKVRLASLEETFPEVERLLLSPENTASLPGEVREAVEGLQPEIRKLRQKALNEIQSREDLMDAAISAGRLAARMAGNPWLGLADEEVTALLAIDWSDETLARSTPEEQQVVRPLVQKARELQVGIRQARTREDLEALGDQTTRIREALREASASMDRARAAARGEAS